MCRYLVFTSTSRNTYFRCRPVGPYSNATGCPTRDRKNSRKTSVLHHGSTFFQLGERRFKGPDELLNSGGQFRGCIAQSNGNRMKNHPFRHCLPHCLTKCLRPKRPTLSLQKHFWPPKQNKRMKKRHSTVLQNAWSQKNEHFHWKSTSGLQNADKKSYEKTERHSAALQNDWCHKNQHLHCKNKCGHQNATNSHEIQIEKTQPANPRPCQKLEKTIFKSFLIGNWTEKKPPAKPRLCFAKN